MVVVVVGAGSTSNVCSSQMGLDDFSSITRWASPLMDMLSRRVWNVGFMGSAKVGDGFGNHCFVDEGRCVRTLEICAWEAFLLVPQNSSSSSVSSSEYVLKAAAALVDWRSGTGVRGCGPGGFGLRRFGNPSLGVGAGDSSVGDRSGTVAAVAAGQPAPLLPGLAPPPRPVGVVSAWRPSPLGSNRL